MITIHVLGFGELFQQLLNAVVAFMKQEGFSSLLRMTALVGIIMVSVGYLKERNPMIYAKWVLGYVLMLQLVITPKTPVDIYDISAQDNRVVDNVPVVFAAAASLITTVGVGLAESYDALLSLPDDLTYTKTGSLFGSRIIQASRDFRIMNPQLKSEMSEYLRNCVVGDIRLNHKYSVSDLSTTQHIWNLISKTPSPLRMVEINGKRVSCEEASKPDGDYSLRAKLDAEIKNTYTIFGVNLFGKMCTPKVDEKCVTNYEALFETRLKSAFDYYQLMTDESANIVLQSMMINAIGDGIKDYQAFTDSTAGIVNNQVTKSQVQHRAGWAIAGQKAAWFLPILHTLLSVLLFGIFPIIMAMSTLPNGVRIFRGYLQFFISLQFWPVLFAILNAAMTLYAKNKTVALGGLSLVNIDKIDELHSDISGVAGYLMLMIPFLAKGLVSNLSDAFNNLATSMSSHLQGSAMSVAQDAASASFSLGQTSFYNTSANNFSANKHDNNWTHMHGMRSEQLGTGVVKAHTASGNTVFDVSPGMTKGAVSILSSKGLSGSLNQAYEKSRQAAANESQHVQTSLSNFAHRTIQLSQFKGHDMKLGDGVSSNESSQYSQAISSMNHIAEDVAKRLGVSRDDAMGIMTSAGLNMHAGISSDRSLLGYIGKKAVGFSGGGDIHGKTDRTSMSHDRYHKATDSVVSAKEAHDFNEALSYVTHFTKSHHFDDSHSEAASLSKQMGADLREAETANHNVDASLSRSERTHQAKSYVESQSGQITKDLNQVFPAYVASRVGKAARDQLYAHPGDATSLQKLEALGQDFLANKREELIAHFGNEHQGKQVDSFYQKSVGEMHQKRAPMESTYQKSVNAIEQQTRQLDVGIDEASAQALQDDVQGHIEQAKNKLVEGRETFQQAQAEAHETLNKDVTAGKKAAQRNTILPKTVTSFYDKNKQEE